MNDNNNKPDVVGSASKPSVTTGKTKSTGDQVTSLSDADISIDWPKCDDYFEIIKKLRLDLSDKSSECEILKIKLDENNRTMDNIVHELNEYKMASFEIEQDTRRSSEETIKSKKLEEDYIKLMNNFLELGEKSDQYKRNMSAKFLEKSNAINNLECFISSGAMSNELEETKASLNQKQADLAISLARIRNLEEENATKEKSIQELKKTLDDAKVTNRHEITVLEEYINCLKNTVTSYEKMLVTYIEPLPEAV